MALGTLGLTGSSGSGIDAMNPNTKDEFMEFAKKKGMVGIKGHRSVGGFRASIYNAMPVSGVEALVAAMQEFEKTK